MLRLKMETLQILNSVLVLFLVLLSENVFSTSVIRADDQWDTNEGTFTDGKLWVNDDIDVYTDGMSSSADMICYNWDADSQWDNCYWDSNGCGSSCNANSCDYFSIPGNMNDNWKTSCDVEVNCQEGNDVPERICSTCDYSTSSTKQKTIQVRVYHDCDNSDGLRSEETVSPNFVWTVANKHKYDCDDSTAKDYEGEYSTNTWVDISSDISCAANYRCSEIFDDSESTTKTYTSFPDPCRKNDGQVCSANSDCASNHCVHGVCRATDPYCSDSYCDSGETYSSCPNDCCDNDCTGYSDSTCRQSCNGYNGCSLISSLCNGVLYNNKVCLDSNTYATCCESSGIDCASNQYCSGGNCNSCSTSCDNSCQSSACYGTDPDCDSSGNPNAVCCGDLVCEGSETAGNCPTDCNQAIADLEILSVKAIQVVEDVEMIKDKTGVVKVIAKNKGPDDASGTVTVIFSGQSLTANESTTKSMVVGHNVSFYFNFKPTVTGNNLIINATISVS
jgi:hypothetical protein